MNEIRHSAQIGGNVPEYSVEEISQQVRRTVESNFGRIRVRGEASGVSTPRSGHIYLKLVQDRHQLDAVIWRSRAQSLSARPADGVEYVATGKLTTYSGKSNYQLIIDRLEEAGEGALLARLERLKAELQAEGLFDSRHKQPIPVLPSVIGVVSSPGGAVIRDILHVLRDRFPRHVLLWPAAVQGPDCPEEVARGIRGFNALMPGGPIPRPDLLIVARGGGSVEDLAGFSEESVVRAAFASGIPLISAVGHETDTPLIDLAADFRAPTPSVAAEKSVPSRTVMASQLANLGGRLAAALSGGTERRRQRLRDLSRGLPSADSLFALPLQRLDHASRNLDSSMRGRRLDNEIRLARAMAKLRQPDIVTASEARLSAAAARLRPLLVSGLVETGARRLRECGEGIAPAGLAAVGKKRQSLSEMVRLLESMSYSQVLKRGYAVVRGKGGLISSAAHAKQEKTLEVEFFDGSVKAELCRDA